MNDAGFGSGDDRSADLWGSAKSEPGAELDPGFADRVLVRVQHRLVYRDLLMLGVLGLLGVFLELLKSVSRPPGRPGRGAQE